MTLTFEPLSKKQTNTKHDDFYEAIHSVIFASTVCTPD